jgi:PAS domain S-box-containing protein
MSHDTEATLQARLELARKEAQYYQRFGEQAGNMRLREAEELSQLIIKHRQAEKALQEERDRAQKYLDIAGVIIVAIDTKGEVTLINQRGCELLGYEEEEIIGKNWFDNFVPKSIRREAKAISRQSLNGEMELDEYFENPVLTKSGQERIVAWHNTILTDAEDNIAGHLSSGDDVTEIKEREQALREKDAELEIKTRNLEEVNTALRVLLKRREKDKAELEEKVLSNVKDLVSPYVEKLQKTSLDANQLSYLSILESNLTDVISPFSRRLSSKYLGLTPTEIQVANLIKHGKTTKEIAEFMSSSGKTIEFHRDNVRRKLGLRNKKVNLRSHLLSM